MKINSLKTTKLKDVCERITVGHVGPMADKYIGEGVPFLRSQNIAPYKLEMDDVKFVSRSFHEKLKKSALKPGDIAIVRTGYPGTACVIPESLSESNCADLVVVTPSKELNPFYLAAIFNSEWGKAKVAGNLVGVAQQHFNITVARELEIFLPSRPMQDRIAEIFLAYENLIENNQRRIKILEEIVCLLYREWFVYFRYPGYQSVPLVKSLLGPIPKGWEVKELEDIVDNVSENVKVDQLTDSLPYLPIDTIPRRSMLLEETRPTSEAQSSLTLFKKGDVLFGAMRVYFHKVILAPFDGVTRKTCFVLRAQKKSLWSFSYLMLFSDQTVAYANRNSKGTTMPYAVWNEGLANMKIVVPSENLLEKFEEALNPMLKIIMETHFKNKNLSQTRDLLLPRLLSGQIPLDEKVPVS